MRSSMHPTAPSQQEPTTIVGNLAHDLATLAHPARGVRLERLLSVRSPGIERHLGRQESLGREVVVLTPAPGSPPEVTEALQEEARLLARLAHPNILPVHAILPPTDEDPLRVLVAHVPGESWERRLSQPHVVRERFGAEDVLAWHVRVLLEVCSAVAHAHAQGLVHRDIHPDSVWIGDLGEVYLVQWAHAVRPRIAQPLSDAQLRDLSSAAYQPPEMVLRSAGRVSVRTDVYQLGGLLYRILTGTAPHAQDDAEAEADVEATVRNVLFRDPPIPHDAPPSLARVCKRALARNPSARFDSVEAFAEALSRALARRGAWSLAAEADARFDVLQRLLRETPVDDAALHRTYGALRLGYAQALEEAPDLATAAMRLERATEQMVSHLLERDDIHAAEAVLASLPAPPEHLEHEVLQARQAAVVPDEGSDAEERLAERGRARDPLRDGGRRAWLSATLALLWVPTPLLTLLVDSEGPWAPLTMVVSCLGLSGAAALIVHLSGADRAESQLTRDLAAWATWATAAVGAFLAIAMLAGLPITALQTLGSLAVVLVAGTAAFSIDRRLVVPAAGFGVASLASLLLPWAWPGLAFGANVVLAAVLLANPSREADRAARA